MRMPQPTQSDPDVAHVTVESGLFHGEDQGRGGFGHDRGGRQGCEIEDLQGYNEENSGERHGLIDIFPRVQLTYRLVTRKTP